MAGKINSHLDKIYEKIDSHKNFVVNGGAGSGKTYALIQSLKHIFSNNPKTILNYTKDVLVCDIHTRARTKRILKENGGNIILGLDEIMNSPINGSGCNEEYGLLGANKATEDVSERMNEKIDDEKVGQGILDVIEEVVKVLLLKLVVNLSLTCSTLIVFHLTYSNFICPHILI